MVVASGKGGGAVGVASKGVCELVNHEFAGKTWASGWVLKRSVCCSAWSWRAGAGRKTRMKGVAPTNSATAFRYVMGVGGSRRRNQVHPTRPDNQYRAATEALGETRSSRGAVVWRQTARYSGGGDQARAGAHRHGATSAGTGESHAAVAKNKPGGPAFPHPNRSNQEGGMPMGDDAAARSPRATARAKVTAAAWPRRN